MKSSKALPLALVFCAALLGGGAWYVFMREDAPPAVGALPTLDGTSVAVEPPPAEPAGVRTPDAVSASDAAAAVATTTVAWPVEVELELQSAADTLRGEGMAPQGSGRTASLRGQVSLDDRRGAQATLTVLFGLNAGRVIETNSEGFFGAKDLYPGLALIRISGPAIPGSLREVRLIRDQDTHLNLSYGAPGSVAGTVYNEANEPFPGVAVELDGRTAVATDEQGIFRFTGVPGGNDVALILRAPGYAPHYERISVLAARDIPAGNHEGAYKYRLQRGASLEVALTKTAGEPGPAQVLLTPAVTGVNSSFAWHLLGPYEVMPGASLQIDDLPPTHVSVRVQHAGARSKPPSINAILRPGTVERVSLELEAAPMLRGRVTDPEGLAAVDAFVRLEAPDRAAATLGFMAMMPGEFELEFYPAMAAALQETRSDHDGNFAFTSWGEHAPAAYLTAVSADGSLRAARAVRADAEKVDLRLAPIEAGRARLELEFGGRHQALPVVVSVNGERRPEVLLPVGQPLEIEGLAAGRWILRARWNGEDLLGGKGQEELDVKDLERRALSLPSGAIQGQDEQTLERARSR
jgi:hypothetical protein